MPDQARFAEFGERAEVLGDRVLPHAAPVYDVEVVAAEPAQVLLDVAAQLVGPGRGAPTALCSTAIDRPRSLGVPRWKAALPVSRIAPKPMRLTGRSPRFQVPAACAMIMP